MVVVLVKSRARRTGGKTVDYKKAQTRKTAARPKSPLEHWVQSTVISWARASAFLQKDPLKRAALDLYHAIPNGAQVIRMQKPKINPRTGKPYPPREALKLIEEGLTPGIEDTFLDWPVRNADGLIICAGFYIEYKRPGKKPTPRQVAVMNFHRALGYRAEWYDDPKLAALAIIEHMSLERYHTLPVEHHTKRMRAK